MKGYIMTYTDDLPNGLYNSSLGWIIFRSSLQSFLGQLYQALLQVEKAFHR